MIIWYLDKPQCFKKTGMDLRFDYHHNKKDWMTTDFFFGWLQRFNTVIEAEVGQEVLLLVEKHLVHCKKETLQHLDLVRADFLPQNTAYKLQSCDFCIFAAQKMRFSKLKKIGYYIL